MAGGILGYTEFCNAIGPSLGGQLPSTGATVASCSAAGLGVAGMFMACGNWKPGMLDSGARIKQALRAGF